ncbi:MAG: hypothetical protein WC476_02525 [Phycisphaerae bacterium]|jgi:hypothetical protein
MKLSSLNFYLEKTNDLLKLMNANAYLWYSCRHFQELAKIRRFYGRRGSSPDVLFLGDSVLERISKFDKNAETIDQMVAGYLDSQISMGAFSHTGYHIGVYYQFIRLLRYLPKKPKIFVFPINVRSFFPQWDINPRHRCTEHILKLEKCIGKFGNSINECLYGIDKIISEDDFLNSRVFYTGTSFRYIKEFENLIKTRPKREDEIIFRLKHIFIYHCMYKLEPTHRKLLLLRDLIQLLKNMQIVTIIYITPVNYKGGLKYVGDDFMRILSSNLQVVYDCIGCTSQSASNNSIFVEGQPCVFGDYSQSLGTEYFFSEHDPSEHLNEAGRTFMAQIISDMIFKAFKLVKNESVIPADTCCCL